MALRTKLRRPSGERDLLDPRFDDPSFSVERDINHRRTQEDSMNTHRPTRRTRLDAIWSGATR